MNCPSCGHENPDHAKFCLECASPFPIRCASCRTELPPRAKFCLECAHPVASGEPHPERDPRSYTPKHLADKILQSKSALEGERKQVTVLFADVKGSMELAEQLDPEEWHAILDRFFQILTEGVHRFEASHGRSTFSSASGTMRRTQGMSLSTRIGINSGEVVVGKIGDDLRMDYTAQGHTVGLAERMQQLAEAGKPYLGEDAEAERELREAHRLYTEMGATGHAERLARELAP